jgi:type IV fimbrial biogenesis protein FimT
MMTIAFPMLADAMTAQRLRASGTDLMSSLLLARSEAIKRNGGVTIRPRVGDNWATGWTVTVAATNEQLDAKDALGNRVAVKSAPDSMTYQGNGRLTVAGVTRLTIVDTSAHVAARCLVIDPSGLPTLSAGAAGGC